MMVVVWFVFCTTVSPPATSVTIAVSLEGAFY